MGLLHPEEPREKSFDDLTPKEAKAYFEWFISYIPKAIEYLQREINESGVATSWQPDYTTESLEILTNWLVKKTWLEEVSIQEIEERIAREGLPDYIAHSMRNDRKRLNKESGWYLFCTGIYFGEMLKSNVEGEIAWDYVKKPKSDININQPVLLKNDSPKGKCPVLSVVTNTLINIKKDGHPEERLMEMYNTWTRIFSEGPQFMLNRINQDLSG